MYYIYNKKWRTTTFVDHCMYLKKRPRTPEHTSEFFFKGYNMSKEIVKVPAGRLTYEDLTSHKPIYITEADKHYVTTSMKPNKFGQMYDAGRAINSMALRSLREYVGDGKDAEERFDKLKVMLPDDMFEELRQLPQIGAVSAVLICIALCDKVPDLKNIYAAAIHDDLFVQYSARVPRGRPDEISTLVSKNLCSSILASEATALLHDCKLKDKPSVEDTVAVAMQNTIEWRGCLIDTTLAKAECRLYHLVFDERISTQVPIAIDEYTRSYTYEDQLNALEQITNSLNKCCIVTGIPGSGKSNMITALDRMMLKAGLERPLLISYTNKATLNLKERLPDYVFEPLNTATVPTIYSAYYRLKGIKGESPLRNTRMIIVDEASMMSSTVLSMVIALLDKCHPDCKLVLVGDVNQLPPVCQYGTPFKNIVEAVKRHEANKGAAFKRLVEATKKNADISENTFSTCVELDTFRRSNGQGIYDSFVKFMSAGKHTIEASESVDLQQVGKVDTAAAIVAKMYETEEDPKRLCCIAETNKQVDTVNKAVIRTLFDLGDHEFVVTTKYLTEIVMVPLLEGVRIVADTNIQSDKHCNGRIGRSEFGTIVSIGLRKSVIRMDIGDREIKLDTDMLQKDFKVGYAATVHKYQGSESDEVVYILENSSNMQGNAFYSQKELKYVGLSRARKKLDIIALVDGTSGIAKPSSITVHVNPTAPTKMMF